MSLSWWGLVWRTIDDHSKMCQCAYDNSKSCTSYDGWLWAGGAEGYVMGQSIHKLNVHFTVTYVLTHKSTMRSSLLLVPLFPVSGTSIPGRARVQQTAASSRTRTTPLRRLPAQEQLQRQVQGQESLREAQTAKGYLNSYCSFYTVFTFALT